MRSALFFSSVALAVMCARVAGSPVEDVRVSCGGADFIVPRTGPLKMVEGNRTVPLLTFDLRVGGERGKAICRPDGRDDHVCVVEDSDTRCVVRTDRSLSVRDMTSGAEARPYEAARLVVDYVFRKDLPGVVVVERLVARKPLSFFSWHVSPIPGFSRFAADGTVLRDYPTAKELHAKPGGYRTNAAAYLLGETPKGMRWFLGREFRAFSPRGDAKPGSFVAPCDTLAQSHGRSLSSGESVSLSVCLGRVRDDSDIAKYRMFRTGDGRIPVMEFAPGWHGVPETLSRGETKDYRPIAGLGWRGRQDLGFSLRLAQDMAGLRLRADVSDDRLVNGFSGRDIAIGDSVEAVFADASGTKTLSRLVSAVASPGIPGGYRVELPVSWKELSDAGIARDGGIRFNLCVTDQDGETGYENWMGVADGVKGGYDPLKWPLLDLAGVRTSFAPERAALPSKEELQRKIDAVAVANATLPKRTEDEYTDCLKAMTEYFLDFMRTDLAAGDTIQMGRRKVTVDENYRHYMLDRINKNADYLLGLQRELVVRQRDLASGRLRPLRTVRYPKGVRPVPEEGGFKVSGKEILLIGPDTWTNVSGWRNEDADVIARMGFNQLDCFYVGGTNYCDLVRRCESNGLYCVWGCALATEQRNWLKDPKTFDWPIEKQNAYRGGKGYFLGTMVPTNPPAPFVYQIAFTEQWDRTREPTEPWAKDFRTHLTRKFGSIEALNAALGSSYADWAAIDFAAALKNDALKYESFLYRLSVNIPENRNEQRWIANRFGLPRSTHYSSHYNIAGLDPLVVLADFEAHWGEFDIVGFDGGFGLEGSEWAMDFAKGGFDYDFARSCYPDKPVANNENHVVVDGVYYEYSNEETYLSNLLAFLMGQNASSVWNWANTRHTYGEYVFTRANTCHEMVRCALDVRRFPEEIAAFRRSPDPPVRIFHSLPSLAERDSYVRSLYSLYGACSFTGWAVRILTERDLARGDYKGTRVLVVPDARRVSDETFAALVAFAKEGGVVLVDGEKALTKDVWGKTVPSRHAARMSFRPFADTSSRTRFAMLNAALAEKGSRFADLQPAAFNIQPHFGVLWRTARTAAGERVAFLTNLSRETVSITVDAPDRWMELLRGRKVAGTNVLKPLDVLLLKETAGVEGSAFAPCLKGE